MIRRRPRPDDRPGDDVVQDAAEARVTGSGNATATGPAIANTGVMGDAHIEHHEHHQHEHHHAGHQVVWPLQVGVIPPAADCRQHRLADDILADLLTPAGEAVVVTQVLSGLGGVGKTQVAVAAARRAWDSRAVDLLVWVTATTRSAIVTGYAQAACELTGVREEDPVQGAARFLTWLSNHPDRAWLVVLDDVQNPADVDALWPPSLPTGRTVVTTRRKDAALLAGRRLVEVGVFAVEEAELYLHAKFTDQPLLLTGAADLAAHLGFLPLALAQAAAYMADRGLDCAGYRQRLADRRRTLADLAPDVRPDGYQATVAVTWSISIDTADTLPPKGLARPVLELAALLDPNTIPAQLFTSTVIRTHLGQRLGRDGPVDVADVTDALHLLDRFNLITLTRPEPDPVTWTIRMHALVQRAVRDATPDNHVGELAWAAGDGLVEIWPDVERDTTLAQTLCTSTTAVRANTGTHLWRDDRGMHPVLYRVGRSLGESGLVTAACDHHQDLTASNTRLLGPDHPARSGPRGVGVSHRHNLR